MNCRCRQAEPVILSTGELVACICIACYAQLPADYITMQREVAEREAYCKHETQIDFTKFGDRHRVLMCNECRAVFQAAL